MRRVIWTINATGWPGAFRLLEGLGGQRDTGDLP